MKKTKKKRELNLALVLVCVSLITVGAVLLFFSFYAVYQAYDLRMAVVVSDTSGFNTDTEFINFGKAMPGNSNSRVIVVSHDYEKPLLIHFKKSGNISSFVPLPDDFYLEPGLSREVTITAAVPSTAQKSSYDGRLTVYFRRI
jgi:hypothetical protein